MTKYASNSRDMVFKQILLKAKDPTLPQETRGVVYEIKCAGNGRDFNGTNSEMSRQS